jgi:hypothetical protein
VRYEQKKAKRVKGKLDKANWQDLVDEMAKRVHNKAGPVPVLVVLWCSWCDLRASLCYRLCTTAAVSRLPSNGGVWLLRTDLSDRARATARALVVARATARRAARSARRTATAQHRRGLRVTPLLVHFLVSPCDPQIRVACGVSCRMTGTTECRFVAVLVVPRVCAWSRERRVVGAVVADERQPKARNRLVICCVDG